MVPHSKLRFNFSERYPSVLSDELVDFLLVALSCSSSRSTTARLIGDVHVSVLKMFQPPSDTAGGPDAVSASAWSGEFFCHHVMSGLVGSVDCFWTMYVS
jgi:hypothetical protein